MNSRLFKRIISSLMIVIMMFSFAGCSDFLKEIAIEKVQDYTEEFIENLKEDPIATISNNSQESVEFPELLDVQQELALQYFDSVSYKISKIKMNNERTSATFTLTFEDVKYISESDLIVGTEDEVRDMYDDFSETDFSFDLKCNRTKKGWIFEDLSELADLMFSSYEEICFLDDDGLPINVTSGYINTIYVDSTWYDPIQGNPTSDSTFRNAPYLQNVFYFNQPITMTFEAQLIKDGECMDSREISMNSNVVATCDFEVGGGANFPSGTYSICILYNEQIVAQSSEITVQ